MKEYILLKQDGALADALLSTFGSDVFHFLSSDVDTVGVTEETLRAFLVVLEAKTSDIVDSRYAEWGIWSHHRATIALLERGQRRLVSDEPVKSEALDDEA